MKQVPVFFRDRSAWRRWLEKNHDKASEIWILAYKKHLGKTCIDYEEALEEAICYGWIDCRMRRIDDEKHMWRFAPRRPNSIWSLKNRKTTERLIEIEEGRMTEHGMAKVDAAKRNGSWDKAYAPGRPPRIPKDLKDALIQDGQAWKNFQAFAKSYRHTYIYWVVSAKREETRKRRIQEVVGRARRDMKPGML
jgi:uncharacterized protein YdeI (YjbR/CyaY-like superfamily)